MPQNDRNQTCKPNKRFFAVEMGRKQKREIEINPRTNKCKMMFKEMVAHQKPLDETHKSNTHTYCEMRFVQPFIRNPSCDLIELCIVRKMKQKWSQKVGIISHIDFTCITLSCKHDRCVLPLLQHSAINTVIRAAIYNKLPYKLADMLREWERERVCVCIHLTCYLVHVINAFVYT